jgi:hypothetical protein
LQHVRTRMQHMHHDFQHKKRNDYIMNTNHYNMSKILLQHRYTTTATLKNSKKHEEAGPSRPAWGSGGRPASSDALHLTAALAMGERRPAAGELRSPRRHPGVRPPGEVRPHRPGMRPPVRKLHPISLGNSCVVCRGRSSIPAPGCGGTAVSRH